LFQFQKQWVRLGAKTFSSEHVHTKVRHLDIVFVTSCSPCSASASYFFYGVSLWIQKLSKCANAQCSIFIQTFLLLGNLGMNNRGKTWVRPQYPLPFYLTGSEDTFCCSLWTCSSLSAAAEVLCHIYGVAECPSVSVVGGSSGLVREVQGESHFQGANEVWIHS